MRDVHEGHRLLLLLRAARVAPPAFSFSRGTTIITQKENKGEYNGIQCAGACGSGGWPWNNSSYDQDIYAHVFDQNGPINGNEVPYQYSTNTSEWLKSGKEYYKYPNVIPRCTTTTATGDSNTRTPEIESLYSGTRIPSTSKACVANTHNAGNWYNFAAATAGSNNASTSTEKDIPNSICPKGWRLPPNDGNKSYNTLIRTAYSISATGSDTTLINNSAMSFIRLGGYNYDYGSVNSRGYGGNYRSSTASSSVGSLYLSFNPGLLNPRYGDNRSNGFSVRCVSR